MFNFFFHLLHVVDHQQLIFKMLVFSVEVHSAQPTSNAGTPRRARIYVIVTPLILRLSVLLCALTLQRICLVCSEFQCGLSLGLQV